MKAAVLVGVAVNGLQENLVDHGPCLTVLVLRFVGVDVVGLRDGVLLQRVELVQLVCWSAEGRKQKHPDRSTRSDAQLVWRGLTPPQLSV